MAAIITRRRWTRQPPTNTVDWSNPLFDGLVDQWVPSALTDSATGQNNASIVGNITYSDGLGGIGFTGAYQASNNYVNVPAAAQFGYTSTVTFEALLSVRAFQTTVFPYISGVVSQFVGVPGPCLRFNDDATLGNAAVPTFFVTTGGGGTEHHANGTALVTGRVYHLLGCVDGSFVRLYVDGVQVGSTAFSGAFDNTAGHIALGSDYTDAVTSHNRCLNGSIYLARIYNTAKGPAEVAALAADPWQRRRTRRLYFGAAAGGGSVGSAVGTSTATGVQGYIGSSTGASAATGVQGYVGRAT
ncbi:MAG: LamG domain-containing protein, partial [Patescibacteria group bacterium]|nr:LamG domain-containing protein [Patescibacteria group bacterium]